MEVGPPSCQNYGRALHSGKKVGSVSKLGFSFEASLGSVSETLGGGEDALVLLCQPMNPDKRSEQCYMVSKMKT